MRQRAAGYAPDAPILFDDRQGAVASVQAADTQRITPAFRQTCRCHLANIARLQRRSVEASAGFMRPLLERNGSVIRIQVTGGWADDPEARVSSLARCCNGIALDQDVGHDVVGNNSTGVWNGGLGPHAPRQSGSSWWPNFPAPMISAPIP
jgi:hypothetical protein